MTESLITISVVGFIAGFIFSMPVAGPISILITSNALKGKSKYCYLAAVGSSFADFTYVFLAVLGLTEFYKYYQPVIPYILLVGSVFLFYVGYKIAKTNLKLESISNADQLNEKIKAKGGFWTGFLINFLNPTLFIGWLTSSFISISLVASLGFNMGGLDSSVTRNVNEINKINNEIDSSLVISTTLPVVSKAAVKVASPGKHYPIIVSSFYAFFLALGSILWFVMFTRFILKNRYRLNINLINKVINILGIILIFFSIYLAGRGIHIGFLR
jgi:threonine/homoserine/homoserine lactone efflux protein